MINIDLPVTLTGSRISTLKIGMIIYPRSGGGVGIAA